MPAMNPVTLLRQLLDPSASGAVHARGVRHLLANGAGTLLYIGMVAALVEIALLDPVPAVIVSVVVFEIYTYWVNRRWVHAATNAHVTAIPRFVVAGLVALGLNTSIMWLTTEVLHLRYFWALVIATAVVPPTNFALNYLWVYRDS
jgi:putative flippase GtrA